MDNAETNPGNPSCLPEPDPRAKLETTFADAACGGLWTRARQWLWAGNPFYILSAAAMLLGVYLVSQEPRLASRESWQLAFNFSSLQLYEWLMVMVAVLLARRAVWYDSRLLVCLENLFVFVPFLLIVQASLIDSAMTRSVCGAAAAMVAGRFCLVWHRWAGAGELPAFLPMLGGLLLGMNLFFPIYFRVLIEMDNDAWKRCSDAVWLFVLPALALGANVIRLPGKSRFANPAPRAVWLGPLLFALWLTGTGVHLAAIDYVGSQPFDIWALAPVIWALLWTAANRLPVLVPHAGERMRKSFLVAPAIAALGAFGSPESRVALVLIAWNAAWYARTWLRSRDALAGHLFYASLVAWLAAFPYECRGWLMGPRVAEDWVRLCLGGYLFSFALASRRLRGTAAGTFFVYWAVNLTLAKVDYGEFYALQAALGFFLYHSQRWQGWAAAAEALPKVLRLAVASAWVGHSLYWEFRTPGASVSPVFTMGALGCVAGALWRLWSGRWPSWPAVAAPVAALLTIPVHAGCMMAKAAPRGYLVILASFVIFGLGTRFALRKAQWNRPKES